MAGRRRKTKKVDVSGAIRSLTRQVDDKLVLSERALFDGAKDLVRDIKARTPVDTGALQDSVRAEKAGKKVQILVGGVNDPRVGRVDYGKYVGMNEIVESVVGGAKKRLARKIQAEVRD